MDTHISRERLRQAINDKEFKIVYQPQVGTKRELIGYEALCRWDNHSPKDFLELALVYRQFLPLSYLISSLIIEDIKKYKIKYVSINLSPVELTNLTHILELTKILEPYKKNISFEITEDAILDKKAIQCMEFLSKEGYRLGLDDFGVGYPRMLAIPKLPIDYIKFDRSLSIQCLDEDYARFLAHWCDYFTYKYRHPLTGECGIPVLAEGVETEKEYQQLKRLGFTQFQGYLFGRPLPPPLSPPPSPRQKF